MAKALVSLVCIYYIFNDSAFFKVYSSVLSACIMILSSKPIDFILRMLSTVFLFSPRFKPRASPIAIPRVSPMAIPRS